jgi:hypothetical protein
MPASLAIGSVLIAMVSDGLGLMDVAATYFFVEFRGRLLVATGAHLTAASLGFLWLAMVGVI